MTAARHASPASTLEETMARLPTHSEMPTARDHAEREIRRVLDEEMMSRRFIAEVPQWPRLQSGVLLVFIGVLMLLVLQQVVTSDPAMQIAHQQRGVSATGSIATHVPPMWERNDP
jgi:hypothetical protein